MATEYVQEGELCERCPEAAVRCLLSCGILRNALEQAACVRRLDEAAAQKVNLIDAYATLMSARAELAHESCEDVMLSADDRDLAVLVELQCEPPAAPSDAG